MDWTGLDRRAALGAAYHDMQTEYRKGFEDHIPHVSSVSLHFDFLSYTPDLGLAYGSAA